MLNRRQFVAIISAFGVAAATSGHSGAQSGPPAAPKGQAIIGFSQEPTVFHPLMPAIEVDQGVWLNLFSPLWGVDPAGNFFPQLAAEVPTIENGGISADGLTWKVKLRGDVKWHDGTPFTAEDVKYTIELIQNPNFRARDRNGHSLVRDITIVSPTEITWKMERIFAPYPSILSLTFIVPKHLLEKEADLNNTGFVNAPVGTGPFVWGERVPGDHITLTANPSYFGEGPHLEQIVFKYIPDMTVLYTQFQTGAIDYIGLQGIPADRYAEAQKLPDRKIFAIPQIFVENILLNYGKPQFTEKAVHEALYYAMDKQSIIEAVYYGVHKPTESVLPPESWVYNPDLPVHVYDPQKANQILDAAGWIKGSDGVREKGGVRLEFTNSTTAGNHLREQAQQILAQNWKEIGVAMTINNMPPAVVWGEYTTQSKFDSLMGGDAYTVGSDPDLSIRLSSKSINAKGGAGQNFTQYENPDVDALIAQGSETLDREKRKKIYQKIQALVRADLPTLPMFQYVFVEGTKANLVGFVPNTNCLVNTWNVNTWYWQE